MTMTSGPSEPQTTAAGRALSAAVDLSEVLFSTALAVDASPLLPVANLDALARAGLYGLVGPTPYGGCAADETTLGAVIEELAAGCLTTAFVWAQHHNAVRTVAGGDAALVDTWLAPLCAGEIRAGVAFAGLRRAGPAPLLARESAAGIVLDGVAPFVTGWGRIDVVHVAARHDDEVIWTLVDATETDRLAATALDLAAVAASGTVRLTFSGLLVGHDRVTLRESYDAFTARDARGLRPNGSHALGVARRAAALAGPSPLDAEIACCRQLLATTPPGDLAPVRAAAADLALRAAALAATVAGGSAVLRASHAQRLVREALFLLVFGQTPAIRTAERARLTARREDLGPTCDGGQPS
jgi:alkylation response protein AidB-like acyl-CoA dehydrogenase